MVSFIDITDKKQMEMAKRKALEQIEQNIEQFAILGDHIRNPLAVIVGLSSLAQSDLSDKIILQAREIDRIITQLDIGWIESEKVRDFIKRYYMVGTEEVAASNKPEDTRKREHWFGPHDLRKIISKHSASGIFFKNASYIIVNENEGWILSAFLNRCCR